MMHEAIVINGKTYELPSGTASELRLIADEMDEARFAGRLGHGELLEYLLEAYELDRQDGDYGGTRNS